MSINFKNRHPFEENLLNNQLYPALFAMRQRDELEAILLPQEWKVRFSPSPFPILSRSITVGETSILSVSPVETTSGAKRSELSSCLAKALLVTLYAKSLKMRLQDVVGFRHYFCKTIFATTLTCPIPKSRTIRYYLTDRLVWALWIFLYSSLLSRKADPAVNDV